MRNVVNLTHEGTQRGTVDERFAFDYYNEICKGTLSSLRWTCQIDEGYYFSYSYDSQLKLHVYNYDITTNNSTTVGGVTYKWNNVHMRWEMASVYGDSARINVVRDSNYWICQGQMLKNGAVYGNLVLNGLVIPDTHGPDLYLHIPSSGKDLFIHTLIKYP